MAYMLMWLGANEDTNVLHKGQERKKRRLESELNDDPRTIVYKIPTPLDLQNQVIHKEITNQQQPLQVHVQSPIMINVGQGTTGTHGIFHATCHLNMTSFHWASFCHNPKTKTQGPSALAAHETFALDAHFRAVETYNHQMALCLKHGNDCSIPRTIELMDTLKQAINDVIISGGVHALHDDPYPKMVPFISRLVQEVMGGTPPILLMSERDPQTWSQRRFAKYNRTTMCRAIFENDGGTTEDLKQKEGVDDPFDLEHCLSQALQQNPPPTKFSDIFTNYNRLLEEANANLKADAAAQMQLWEHELAQAMEQFQNHYRPQAAYTIDLFTSNNRISEVNLAKDMYQQLVGDHSNNSIPSEISRTLVHKQGMTVVTAESGNGMIVTDCLRASGRTFLMAMRPQYPHILDNSPLYFK
jgi:hypothetical protein